MHNENHVLHIRSYFRLARIKHVSPGPSLTNVKSIYTSLTYSNTNLASLGGDAYDDHFIGVCVCVCVLLEASTRPPISASFSKKSRT